jgi:hypothetical protein
MQGDQIGLSSGDELHQRIKYLKDKRKSDLVNLVLNAAGKGDLGGLKQALKVRNIACILVQRNDTIFQNLIFDCRTKASTFVMALKGLHYMLQLQRAR